MINDINYDEVKSVAELKADLLYDLHERYRELKDEGKDDDTAFEMTIDSIGDIEQTVQEVANLSRSLERQVLTNFSASNLPKSDFAGVAAHIVNFESSARRGSDFAGADLTGSTFIVSDVRETNFNGANLTDCIFSTVDLTGLCLDGLTFLGVRFDKTALNDVTFKGATLKNVSFPVSNLSRKYYRAIKTVSFDGAIMDKLTYKQKSA